MIWSVLSDVKLVAEDNHKEDKSTFHCLWSVFTLNKQLQNLFWLWKKKNLVEKREKWDKSIFVLQAKS